MRRRPSLQVYDDHVALTCEAPAVVASRADGRSLRAAGSMTFASTPNVVDAYNRIDPDIRC
ncbi:MAG: hypothetical protein ACT6U0_02355 [Shinella sp.]|uniref:hypothetical protein n=1 Tax=Shinella sp. TaxID=1870904 RepID=UPI004035FCE4